MALPTQSVTVFQGDTFIADGLYRNIDGTAADLSVLTIEAHVRDKNNVKYPISVEKLTETGEYRLVGDSSDWPLGRNQLIIRYTQDDVRRTAEPIQVVVEPA